jgi:Tol biopolymer transport system component/serine/threonine protein kinase
MTLPDRARLGPYEILGFIGAGGMGEVYHARDTRLDRDVAVKVISPRLAHDASGLRRFELEARTASALNHPNVLGIHDIGTHEGSPYVVSELLEGDTLRVHLRRGLTVQKAIEIAVQVAHGLAAAHEKGIVHRDLKPSNIFITRDGRAKILDFGLAKLVLPEGEVASTEPTRPHTSPGALVGTVGYASPEQVCGEGSDARSDVFALGVVLYEMLARVPPFRGDTRVDVLAAMLHADPPSLSSRNSRVPPSLEALVRRCLEKRPEERFQSARDLAFALESTLTLVQSDQGARLFVPRLPRHRFRGRGLRYSVVAAGLAIAALTGFLGKGLVRPPGPPLADPRDLSPLQLTTDPGVESEPALSPDGSFVAYTAEREGGTDIWLADVRGGPALRLTRHPAADTSPTWYPDGSALAFVSEREGSLGIWRVPRLGGPPKRLLPNALDPAVSPDGKQLAFARPQASGVPRIGIVTIGAPDTVRLVSPEPADLWGHWQPAWSPNGTELCFSNLFDLSLLDVATGEMRELTRDHAGDTHPVFSSDGKRVYFSSGREGTLALWRIGVDGRGLQRMTFGTGPENRPSLAGGGSLLAYSTHSAEPDLILVDRATGDGVRLSEPGEESSPSFLAGGAGLVFASDRDRTSDLWVQPLEDGRPAGDTWRLTDEPGSESIVAPSPDGRWIAYVRARGGRRDIWMAPTEGGPPRVLVESPAQDLHPAWSPDGSRVAFASNRGGSPDIWMATIRDDHAAGEPTALTRGEATDYLPAWSPDGRFIAFVRTRAGASDAWVVAADGDSAPRRLTANNRVECVRWEPNSRALLVSARWGDDSTTIHSVPLDGGAPRALQPTIDLGRTEYTKVFDLSPDGRTVVFAEHPSRGDVWLLEAREGQF